MWECPECNELIEHLSYSVPTTAIEFGSAYLTSRRNETERITDHDFDSNDNDGWDGRPSYSCPECDCELSPASLVWNEGECDDELEDEECDCNQYTCQECRGRQIREDDDQESSHEIIRPKSNIVRNEIPKDISESSILCKECRHIIIIDDESNCGVNDCPKCGTTNTTLEYEDLVEKGFFSTIIKKQHVTKKNTGFKWAMGKLRSKIRT